MTFCYSSHLSLWSLLSFLLNSQEHLIALSLDRAGTSWDRGQALGVRPGCGEESRPGSGLGHVGSGQAGVRSLIDGYRGAYLPRPKPAGGPALGFGAAGRHARVLAGSLPCPGPRSTRGPGPGRGAGAAAVWSRAVGPWSSCFGLRLVGGGALGGAGAGRSPLLSPPPLTRLPWEIPQPQGRWVTGPAADPLELSRWPGLALGWGLGGEGLLLNEGPRRSLPGVLGTSLPSRPPGENPRTRAVFISPLPLR